MLTWAAEEPEVVAEVKAVGQLVDEGIFLDAEITLLKPNISGNVNRFQRVNGSDLQPVFFLSL